MWKLISCSLEVHIPSFSSRDDAFTHWETLIPPTKARACHVRCIIYPLTPTQVLQKCKSVLFFSELWTLGSAKVKYLESLFLLLYIFSTVFEVCCLEASGGEVKEFIARKQQTRAVLICFLFSGFCCLEIMPSCSCPKVVLWHLAFTTGTCLSHPVF